MNREVLFRGKTTDTGEWVYGYLASGKHWLDEDSMTVIIPTDGTFYPHCEISEYDLVDPETVGQYVGWEDVKGNKIFEGDILESTTRRSDRRILISDIYNASGLYIYISEYGYEIIGNIWDNLEKIMEVEK